MRGAHTDIVFATSAGHGYNNGKAKSDGPSHPRLPCRDPLGPEHTGHFVEPHVAAHCGGAIYSRRKPLFSSFGEHTAVCGSSVRQAVARPRHRQSVCIHNIHVVATCRPSVLGSATMRGHMWLNKVASVLGPLGNMTVNMTLFTNHCDEEGAEVWGRGWWSSLVTAL